VLHFTGKGSIATIMGNVAGVYFRVRAVGANGTNELVEHHPRSRGTTPHHPRTAVLEIQATGPWRVTIT
jgi:hypothetical protein